MDEQLSKYVAEALRLADLVGRRMGIPVTIAADLDTPTIMLGAGYIWIGAGLAYVDAPVIYIEAETHDGRLIGLPVTNFLVYSLVHYGGSRDEPPSDDIAEIASHSQAWAAVKSAFEAYAAWQIDSVLESDAEDRMEAEIAEAERHAEALERWHTMAD